MNAKLDNYIVLLEPIRTLFFVMPRVCSNSIKNAILEYMGINVEYKTVRAIDKNPALTHITMDDVRSKYMDYRKVTFVRNPFDRIISFWEYKVHEPGKCQEHCKKLGFTPEMEFADALGVIEKDPRADIHFHPQGELLIEPDFVGRYENLTADWARMKDYLYVGFPDLLHLNASKRKPYKAYYDESLRERVAKIYKDDLDWFGHEF